jgi:Na+-transporting NADH:ubiquinone oxidoreductase subunit A
MAAHKIKKGLNLPIAGEPDQRVEPANPVRHVALVAADYVGMKPQMEVEIGSTVRRGQLLFTDKKTPGVRYTAPGAGTIVALNRGAKRALQSLVIELSPSEQRGAPGDDEWAQFEAYTGNDPAGLNRQQITELLLESGLWTALRTRPFSKVVQPGTQPAALFITATDTHPLAPNVDVVYQGNEQDFQRGVLCVSKLCDGPVYLCKHPGSAVDAGPHSGVQVEEFSGPHPAGTVGLHIHRLHPVHRNRMVWHLGYQDVIAIGKLFRTGKLDVTRVISFAGPQLQRPRLIATRIGAATEQLAEGEMLEGENRIVSGSVFGGRTAMGEVHGFLGRYVNQITVLREGREREFLGWLTLGINRYSTLNTYLSRLTPGKRFAFSTNVHGSPRAMVPIGMYERVMPFDLMPTFLLRAMIVDDLETAEKLGVLELDEEDVALCTFVCPGKYEYGPILRRNLSLIESEG